jgi:beta-carotene 15,15'-dioxygenase
MFWPSLALIALILLSLWHFGEQAQVEYGHQQEATLLRFVQGGSSVMLPVLLSPDALKPWVQSIASADTAWVWPLWVGMAGLWASLLLVALVLIKPWRFETRKTLWIELIALIALNLHLSPLLAFALFFGVYHSGAHIGRMRQLQLREGKTWHDGLLAATMLATLLALAALMWWMSNQAFALRDAGQWLRTLVVALAALTLPHLILVSRARYRLFTVL